MMKNLLLLGSLATCLVVGCSTLIAAPVLHEKAFHDEQDRIIEAHKKLLVKAGRITDSEHFMAFIHLGVYGWYSGICDEYLEKESRPSPCSFGAYKFSQAAFEQAKRMYVIHGQMEGGSDLLIDVGAGAFDKEVVGHTVTYLTYCALTGGKLRHCDEPGFADAKVIEFIDKYTVRLNKKAKWDAQMYGLEIVPPDYVDMCECTNRF